MPTRVFLPPIEKAADLVGANIGFAEGGGRWRNLNVRTAASLGSIVGNVAKAMEL